MNRTPDQKKAIETRARFACVDAGAGSGKTSVLVERILHLVENGLASLDQVVAITFTDAAASEMKTRLRKEFKKRAPVTNPDEMSRWRELERNIDFARISSIHSFCASLLRENALAVGLDPEFTVIADAEDILLRDEVVTETLQRLLAESFPPAANAAVEMGIPELQSTLVALLDDESLMRQVAAKHPLHDADALFAEWKQAEFALWQSRLAVLRDHYEILKRFNGVCESNADAREQLRTAMILLLELAFGADNTADIRSALTVIGEMNFNSCRSKKNWPDEMQLETLKEAQKAIRDGCSKFAPSFLDDSELRQLARLSCDLYQVYGQVQAAFRQAKEERTCLNFNDLIANSLELLAENEEFCARIAGGIKHLLIDEFQDTDWAQLEIARLLTRQKEAPALFIVGDAKQSIYDFRGAEVELFQQQRASALELIRLAENFRSLPDVLEFINDYFEKAGALRAVEDRYARMKPHRAPIGEARVEFLIPPESDLKAEEARAIEAEMIASRIDQFCRGGAPCVWDKDGECLRPARFGDVAMLFRSTTSLYIYEEALRRHDIPFLAIGGAGFYERQEILDLTNLLSLLVDPMNEPALLGFLRSPIACMSDEDILRLVKNGGLTRAFYSAKSADNAETQSRLAAARDLLAELRANSAKPLPEFLRYVIDRTGYEAIMLSQFLGVQKALNVRRLMTVAAQFNRTSPPSLAAFVHYLELVGEQELRESDATVQGGETGNVMLMTIHKAKGLEFPIVFIPDISREAASNERESAIIHRDYGLSVRATGRDGASLYPPIYHLIRDAKGVKAEAESARVLYVAMTRAMDWLLLSGTPTKKESWMTQLDRQYDILERQHNEEVAGDKWKFRVCREAAAPIARMKNKTEEVAAPDLAALKRRAGPVSPGAVERRVYSVSEVLNCMYPLETDENASRPETRAMHAPALVRGTLAHKVMEQWNFAGPPPIAAVLERELLSAGERDELGKYLNDATDKFIQSPIGKKIAQSNAAELRREQPFLLRVGGALISGVIDLILPDATLLDYKTGRDNPHMTARYDTQLRLYAAALRQLANVEPPEACVYYLESGNCHMVSTGEPELADALRIAADAINRLRTSGAAVPARAAGRGTVGAME